MYIRVPVPIDHTLGEFFMGDEPKGPFEGTFTGTATGDSKTTATITAQLTHQGTKIKGNVFLGRGLRLGFGFPCREEDVDLTQIPIDTIADPNNLRFTTTTQVDEPTTQWGLAFMRMNVTITAELSSDPDHRTITAKVTLKPVKGLNADRSESQKPIVCTGGEKILPVQLQRQ
ncbi:MAG TPA: hypothetical protein VK901_07255 [Nitrospiraceae bacterium]|nr:hypothetical protein [Nitrospiraceae bacterium]